MYESGTCLCYFSKNSNILCSSALRLSRLNQNMKNEWDPWMYNGHFKTKWNLANYNVLRWTLPGFSVKLKFQPFFSEPLLIQLFGLTVFLSSYFVELQNTTVLVERSEYQSNSSFDFSPLEFLCVFKGIQGQNFFRLLGTMSPEITE